MIGRERNRTIHFAKSKHDGEIGDLHHCSQGISNPLGNSNSKAGACPELSTIFCLSQEIWFRLFQTQHGDSSRSNLILQPA